MVWIIIKKKKKKHFAMVEVRVIPFVYLKESDEKQFKSVVGCCWVQRW